MAVISASITLDQFSTSPSSYDGYKEIFLSYKVVVMPKNVTLTQKVTAFHAKCDSLNCNNF